MRAGRPHHLRKGDLVKVYIATRLENWKLHNVLRDALAVRGVGLSYDWSTHGPVWEAGRRRIREVSQLEALGVMEADLVVVLLPGGRGTHAELGMALAARVPVVLWAPGAQGDFFDAAPVTCAFYHHPGVVLKQVGCFEQLAEAVVGELERRRAA